jgi:hypothetical protein
MVYTMIEGGRHMTANGRFDVERFDALLARGLSKGVGDPDGQMCIEAAICQVLGLPHGDDPGCVAMAVRGYAITLDEGSWSSAKARAAGLRDLGLAQLGSRDVVDNREFAERMALKTVQRLIPALVREVWPDDPACLQAADACESATDLSAARAAVRDAEWAAARAAESAASAAEWAAASAVARAVESAVARAAVRAAEWAAKAAAWAAESAAERAAGAAASGDKFLLMSAALALETLRELNSPGCALITLDRLAPRP